MKRLVAGLLVAFVPATADANPWDLYGFNPRAMGMAGAATAVADDFTAVYYNPAALTATGEGGFGFGYSYSKPQLSLNYDRPESQRSILGVEAPDADGVTFGGTFTLGGSKLAGRLAGGIALNIPTTSLLSGQALDPATPQWSMYQALPRRLVAALSFGAQPFDFLSIGAGFQIMAGVTGRLDYELDPVVGQFTQKSVSFDIEPIAAPIVSMELRPLDGLRLAFTWRGAIDSKVDLPVDLEITDLADLAVTTLFRVQYSPHRLNWGASYEHKPWGLLVALDLNWALWSKAPDPSATAALDVSGDLFEETGFDQALDVPAPGRERTVDLAYSNVLELKVGAEQRLDWLVLRAGYAITPTPAPRQTSGTNYVDGTRHTLSAGAGVRFQDPLGALARPLSIDAAAGLGLIASRRHDKVTPDDPVGGYSASGRIWMMSVSLRYEYGEAASSAAPLSETPPPAAALAPLDEPDDAPVLAPTRTATTAEVDPPLPEGDNADDGE